MYHLELPWRSHEGYRSGERREYRAWGGRLGQCGSYALYNIECAWPWEPASNNPSFCLTISYRILQPPCASLDTIMCDSLWLLPWRPLRLFGQLWLRQRIPTRLELCPQVRKPRPFHVTTNTDDWNFKAAQSLFDYSMYVSDLRWDDYYKYIRYQEKGEFNTRFTAWYIVGLLARNRADDVENAKAAIENM